MGALRGLQTAHTAQQFGAAQQLQNNAASEASFGIRLYLPLWFTDVCLHRTDQRAGSQLRVRRSPLQSRVTTRRRAEGLRSEQLALRGSVLSELQPK